MAASKPILSIAALGVTASTPPLRKRHPHQSNDYNSMHGSSPSSLPTTALSTAPPRSSPQLHAPTSYHKQDKYEVLASSSSAQTKTTKWESGSL
jgi:hypothetical protein